MRGSAVGALVACAIHGAAGAEVRRPRRVLLSLAILLIGVAPARAQTFGLIGTRAVGMGGAFVAVADDATAVYWNPAGLANSALVDATIQYAVDTTLNPDQTPLASGGWRHSATLASFALPSLGVSYFRARIARAPSPTADSTDSRQHGGPGMAAVSSLAIDEAGVTLLQSLLANLVVGTTLKVARGSSAVVTTASDGSLSAAFDLASDAPANAVTRFDLDVGVLVSAGPVRIGLTGRNLSQPDFGPDDPTHAGRLERQVRVGVALTPGFVVNRTAASQPALTIAVDADLTRSTLGAAEQRLVAAGVERWFMGRRLGLRGGVHASTLGSARAVATAGASVAVRAGVMIEGQFGRGSQDAGQQWSVGGRVTF